MKCPPLAADGSPLLGGGAAEANHKRRLSKSRRVGAAKAGRTADDGGELGAGGGAEQRQSEASRRTRRRQRAAAAEAGCVVTVNCTSWHSVKEEFQTQQTEIGKALVVGLQEVKIAKGELADVEKWCDREGWVIAVAPCLRGTKGGRSAGTAVCWRKFLHRLSNPEVLIPGRAVSVALEICGCPANVVSYYGSDGSSIKRAAEVQIIQEWAAKQKLPMILMGDFNEEPWVTAARFPSAGTVVATDDSDPTCITQAAASVIDYFVVSNLLLGKVRGVGTVASSVATHRAVAMRLTGLASDPWLKVVSVGSRSAGSPVFGPHFDFAAEQAELWIKWHRDFEHMWQEVGSPTSCLLDGEIADGHWAAFDNLWDEWDTTLEQMAPSLFGHRGTCGRPFAEAWTRASKVYRPSKADEALGELSAARLLLRAVLAWVAVPHVRSLMQLQEVAAGLAGVSLPASFAAVRNASWAGATTEAAAAAAAVPALRAEVNVLERKVRAEREAAWTAFLRDQMETGTSWAHAFTKPKHSALVVLGAGGGDVDSPMHHLEKEQANLKKLWL